MGITDLLPVKELYELVKKGTRLEAEEAIMKYRETVLEQSEEILNLKIKVRELEDKLNLRNKLEKTDNGFYIVEADGTKDGPYCIRCKEVDDKLISLKKMNYATGPEFVCTECKNSYGEETRSSSIKLGRS